MKRKLICRDWTSTRLALVDLASALKSWFLSGNGALEVSVRPLTRTLEQNNRLWALLTDVSEQVDWYGKKLSPTDWKNVFSSAMKKLDVVPNLDGTGFVALGMSTSQMSKGEMADMQTLIEAFGVEKGVRFKAPDWMADE